MYLIVSLSYCYKMCFILSDNTVKKFPKLVFAGNVLMSVVVAHTYFRDNILRLRNIVWLKQNIEK